MKTSHILIASLVFILNAHLSFAQQEIAYSSTRQTSTKNSVKPPEMFALPPSFNTDAGYSTLDNYMNSNVKYPDFEKKHGIEGIVMLQYYINKDGSIENIKVAKSISKGLDNEAIRLVSNMPSWNPAIQNGQPQRVKYLLPVKFELTF